MRLPKAPTGDAFKGTKDLDIDMTQSVMFGDKRGDMQAALAAGVTTRILVGKDGKNTPEAVPESTNVALNLKEGVSLFLGK